VAISFLFVLFHASAVRRAAHTLRAPRGVTSMPQRGRARRGMMRDNDDNDEDDNDWDIIVGAHRAQLAS